LLLVMVLLLLLLLLYLLLLRLLVTALLLELPVDACGCNLARPSCTDWVQRLDGCTAQRLC